MNTSKAFAVRLRELRTAANLTQQELADRSGLHRQGIAKLENGEREPAWATVQALASALGVDCTAFQTGADVQPGEQEPIKLRGRPRKATEAEIAGEKPATAKKGKRKDK